MQGPSSAGILGLRNNIVCMSWETLTRLERHVRARYIEHLNLNIPPTRPEKGPMDVPCAQVSVQPETLEDGYEVNS